MQRYAIILASENYLNYDGTPYCHKDATLLRKTLLEHCDYPEQNISISLLSKEDHSTPLNILSRIEEVLKQTNDGDTILFYYAGHGHLAVDNEPYLILPNTDPDNTTNTALPLRRISGLLRLPGRTSVRIFDSCHSGADVRAGGIQGLNTRGFMDTVLKERAESDSIASGWITFAACQADEYSYADPELRHGIFTYTLCEAIIESSPNRFISPEQLKLQICERMAQWCENTRRKQTPTCISAISGNVSIAKRIKLLTEQKPEANYSDVRERVDALRHGFSVDGESRQQFIILLTAHLKASLESNLPLIETFGGEKALYGPYDNNKIPEALKRHIVLDFENSGLESEHQIAIHTEYGLPPMHALNSFVDLYGGKYGGKDEVKYLLSQGSTWPSSCVWVRVSSDGYVPYAIVLVYLIPLQTRIMAMSLIATGEEKKGSVDGDKISWAKPRLYRELIDYKRPSFDHIDNQIKMLAASFNLIYAKEAKNRIEYLEKERAR